jgi:hypothetical protein
MEQLGRGTEIGESMEVGDKEHSLHTTLLGFGREANGVS